MKKGCSCNLLCFKGTNVLLGVIQKGTGKKINPQIQM
jgi:hypothetical protein